MPRLLASAIFLFLLVLLPFLFSELILASLAKLHLSPKAALILLIGILAGGLINIPVKTLVRDRDVVVHPFAVFGLAGLWPQLRRVRRTTVIAVNVGGCLIPTGLAIYEIMHLAAAGTPVLVATAIGCAINVLVCYFVAQPIPEVGIVMPGFVPPLVAVALAIFLVPDTAAPVAFVIGVMGPLVGADLLHLSEIEAGDAGVVSIGGAGTFDGIVLSGIVAAYLA